MVGKATNCAQIRERMFDAASNSLSASVRVAFDTHLGDCAACAEEFRKVQTLAQAIDQGLSASLSVEPSPRLIGNVRRQIIAQPYRATWSRQWSTWLTAAGACAALAILILTVRSAREFSRPTADDHGAASINAPLTSKPTVHRRVNAAMQAPAAVQPRRPARAVVTHVARRAPHQNAAEPEIIVEPGQMQAILRFVAATQSGQIDGARLLIDQKNTAEPLEIKPLMIAPLKIEPLNADSAPPSLGSGENSERSVVAGHSD